jgi:hypothetical protein
MLCGVVPRYTAFTQIGCTPWLPVLRMCLKVVCLRMFPGLTQAVACWPQV